MSRKAYLILVWICLCVLALASCQDNSNGVAIVPVGQRSSDIYIMYRKVGENQVIVLARGKTRSAEMNGDYIVLAGSSDPCQWGIAEVEVMPGDTVEVMMQPRREGCNLRAMINRLLQNG